MNKFIRRRKKNAKICLISAVFTTILFLGFSPVFSQNQFIEFQKKSDELPIDSPFLDSSPRIDGEAAAIEAEKGNQGKKNYETLLRQNNHCRSLPQNFWVVIFGAYVFLIIFNLSYQFKKTKKLRWFWESLYAALALLAWYNFDECRKNNWFAQSVILDGIIIYAFYFYYFNKNKSAAPQLEKEKEKTARLPFE